MQKKTYTKPQMEIVVFDTEDVITTSNPMPSDPNESAIIMSKDPVKLDL